MFNKQVLYKLRSLVGLVGLAIILTLLSPRFLTLANLTNVLRQTSLNAIIAVGMTFVILTGGIDLSVGSIFAFASAITAGMLIGGVNVVWAVAAGLVVGALSGAVNGLLITKGKVPAFICTLAMMTILRGATMVYTNGQPLSGLGDAFYFVGEGFIGIFPVPVIITVIVFAIGYYILSQYKIGRYIYALGGNEEAARLSGINTDFIKIMTYAISGLLAALSGIIIASRLNSAQPTAGVGSELDAIAAVVLGGTSLSGGQGGVVGTIIGALIIGVLNNGLNLLNVSPFYQLIAKGAVILLAILLDKKEN
ncbi:MAG TPA: ribose ABC transporter permease [Firmicutes bacterium]|jgi:ribose transport system permease protein|nr:ribose ABC transporter permease [Bacillota bacterium]